LLGGKEPRGCMVALSIGRMKAAFRSQNLEKFY
jgi:hypothetical protein